MDQLDISQFEAINHDIHAHIFELYTSHNPRQEHHLGYVNRKESTLTVSISDEVDFTVEQSPSELASGRESSSTGFVCWQTTTLVAQWLLQFERGPFYGLFSKKSDFVVIELGTGVSGILACALGPKVGCYICTDQEHILKLLRRNIVNNVSNVIGKTVDTTGNINQVKLSKSSKKSKKSSKVSSSARIEVLEYDWEHIEYGLSQINSILSSIESETKRYPDMLIACDTIYNEYLVPHFLDALTSLMGPHTVVLIGIQLRDELVLEQFLVLCIAVFDVYLVPYHMVPENMSSGFVTYFMKKSVK